MEGQGTAVPCGIVVELEAKGKTRKVNSADPVFIEHVDILFIMDVWH